MSYRSIYTGESTTGSAVKAAVQGMMGAVKAPAPPYRGPSFAVSPFNQARLENRQQLRQQLGRRPTREEKREGMRIRKDAARQAGAPLLRINADNSPISPSPAGEGWYSYPYTLTNPDFFRAVNDNLRNTGQDASPDNTHMWMDEIRLLNRRKYTQDFLPPNYREPYGHPIDPNASLRTLFRAPIYGSDPRKPERDIRARQEGNPLTPEQQQEADQLRRGYYEMYPTLIPAQGQPGYRAWQRQLQRGGR
jgi:hypothetical protein